MPVVTVEYDDQDISDAEMRIFCETLQQIVLTVTETDDVSVYAHSAHIKVGHAPIEIFVRVSAHKVVDVDHSLSELKKRLAAWKDHHRFRHPINLTLIPMNWKYEIGI